MKNGTIPGFLPFLSILATLFDPDCCLNFISPRIYTIRLVPYIWDCMKSWLTLRTQDMVSSEEQRVSESKVSTIVFPKYLQNYT